MSTASLVVQKPTSRRWVFSPVKVQVSVPLPTIATSTGLLGEVRLETDASAMRRSLTILKQDEAGTPVTLNGQEKDAATSGLARMMQYCASTFAPIAIPKGASFKDMVALKGKSDIGDQINKKIIAPLANANKLPDMPDFNDATKLGSGKEMVDRLTNLIAITATVAARRANRLRSVGHVACLRVDARQAFAWHQSSRHAPPPKST